MIDFRLCNFRPPSFWLGSQPSDGDRARSKSWCDRSAQADRTQQPSSSVASGFVLFFPSSARPRSFEFVTLLNSMNDGLHEGNQPGTKPFIGYKPAFDCPSMHISCDPQDYLTFAAPDPRPAGRGRARARRRSRTDCSIIRFIRALSS